MELSKLKQWAFARGPIMEEDHVDSGRSDFLKRAHFYSDPTVKVSNWEYTALALPFDNVAVDQKTSQYNRLGCGEDEIPISVSKESQLKIFQSMEKRKRIHCPMMNLITYPTTLSDKREESRVTNNLVCNRSDSNIADYRTTTFCDYRIPYPFKHKLIPLDECLKVPRQFGRTTMHPYSAILKPGYSKFMDDDQEEFYVMKKQPKTAPPYSYHFPVNETWRRIRQEKLVPI